MKKEINYVDGALFQKVIAEVGCQMTAQAGFVKVHGPKGRQVYVAKTKNVGRVDISGFEMDGEGFTAFPEHGGSVTQQLDFSLPPEKVLANFERALRHMLTLQPVEKKAKVAPGRGTPRPKAQGWTGLVEASLPPKESRKEQIERLSRERGVPVSKKTQAEFAAAGKE